MSEVEDLVKAATAANERVIEASREASRFSYAPIFNEAIDAALTAIKFSSSDINQER